MLTAAFTFLLYQWKFAIGLAMLYSLAKGLYNITLHPLSRAGVPGRFLAAFTHYYEIFWCFYCGRSIYYQKVLQMHRQYGPVVRISPNEISLSETSDLEEIYNVRSNYTKDETFYRSFSGGHGMFAETNPTRHRARRAPWSCYFSTTAVQKLQPMVQAKVQKLCQKLMKILDEQETANVQILLHSLMVDIVSEYTLHRSLDFLDNPQKAELYVSTMFETAGWLWMLVANPVAYYLGRFLFAIQGKILGGAFHELYEYCSDVLKSSNKAKFLDQNTPGKPAMEYLGRALSNDQPTSKPAVCDEIYAFNVAAAFNFGTVTSVALYHLLSEQKLHSRAMVEIQAHPCLPQNPSQSLPFLAACIKEGLRLGYGPIGRMPRVVPSHGKSFHGYPIPQGVSSASSAETGLTCEKTVVGVWNYVYHHNASIWGKDHESFNPDRWLDQTSLSLDEHLLTFGRDSFRCIGRDLAMYTMFASLFELLKKFESLRANPGCNFQDLDDHFAATVPRHRSRLIVYRTSNDRLDGP